MQPRKLIALYTRINGKTTRIYQATSRETFTEYLRRKAAEAAEGAPPCS